MDSFDTSTVVVACRDPALRKALTRGIEAGGRFRVRPVERTAGLVGGGLVVVLSVADTSPEECRRMVAGGAVVIVLAPLPSDWQRQLYEAVGGRYLPMDPDSVALARAIEEAWPPPASARTQLG